jgi:hypothetical protein
LHPRPILRKSFRRTLLASNRDASGCTMSALRRHYQSLSPPGVAWHRKSEKRSWNWCGLAKHNGVTQALLRGDAPPNGKRPIIGILDSEEGVISAALVGVMAFCLIRYRPLWRPGSGDLAEPAFLVCVFEHDRLATSIKRGRDDAKGTAGSGHGIPGSRGVRLCGHPPLPPL